MANGATDATLSLVPGAIYAGGRALRRAPNSGSTNIGGPIIYPDEFGAAPLDTVTVRGRFTGDGATVSFAMRARNAAGSSIGSQETVAVVANSSTISALGSVTFELPAGTAHVDIFPFTLTAGKTFQMEAFWAYKGPASAGPEYPIVTDNEYQAQRNAELGGAISQNAATVTATAAKVTSLAKTIDSVTTGARLDGLSMSLGSAVNRTEADGFTGFGETFTTPGALSSNACYIGSIPRGATTKKWTKVKVVMRTHATDPAAAGSTVVAVGELKVDPETAPLGELIIPWRDPVTNALKTVTQAELLAQYGLMYQVWVDDAVKATCGEQRATSISGATALASYCVTTPSAQTGLWSLLAGGVPIVAITAINFSSISQADATILSDAAKKNVLDSAQSSLPYADSGRMRQFRSFASRRMQPVPEAGLRLIYGLLGDSWSTSVAYMSKRLANSLIAKLGDGGVGWVGFGFTSGAMAGDARGLYLLDSPLTNWTSNYHSGSTSPNISDIRSSTAGALYKIANALGATHPALSGAKLHFTGTADGVIRWRWNGGAWSANSNVQGTVGLQQTLDLAGFPTAALSGAVARTISLEIEVVSGAVILCGVDLQSATDGIVLHKLGSSGAKASDWQTSATASWRAAIAALGLNAAQVLLATNDRAASVGPTTFAGQMGALCTALKTAIPAIDVMFIVPPENTEAAATPMSAYATAMRPQAVASKAAFLDLQSSFGDATNAAEYGPAGTVPLFLNAAHPNDAGACIEVAEIERVLMWR
ncbi:hypothetical protein D3C86_1099720 [compost metagenome]